MRRATTVTAFTAAPSSAGQFVVHRYARLLYLVVLTVACIATGDVALDAHGVSGFDALFLQGITGPAIGPLMYLGAKHMVTGYDHLAFLVGVIFFLYRPRDILLYVTLFTVGHSLTLLAGVLGGIRVNAYLIDAIIGVSVIYKALENLGCFSLTLGFQPDTRAAVFIFGLFHGLGLATKLQEFALPANGLVVNIVSFNVGVEIGQFVALTAVFALLNAWRSSPSFFRHAYVTNTALLAGGLLLMGYQLTAFALGA